ncbi:MAG: hypothetical protein BGO34_22320 [Bacteroidia bacterium 44-10]|nr:MAG: hypothetical protein BGO34_22320 [Bacteroidia bacterium 44-10]
MRFGNLRMQASKIALTFHYISIIFIYGDTKQEPGKHKKSGKDFVNPFENNIFVLVKEEGSRTHRFLFYSLDSRAKDQDTRH